MSHIYPRAPAPEPEVPAFSETACADKIIEMREADEEMTLERAMGHCLAAGGGMPADVTRVWGEIVREVVALRAVPPPDHSTSTSFNSALADAAGHLDPVLWYEGLKAEKKVTTWEDLKAAFTVEAQEL